MKKKLVQVLLEWCQSYLQRKDPNFTSRLEQQKKVEELNQFLINLQGHISEHRHKIIAEYHHLFTQIEPVFLTQLAQSKDNPAKIICTQLWSTKLQQIKNLYAELEDLLNNFDARMKELETIR